jgi:YjbE family integral membrane protein
MRPFPGARATLRGVGSGLTETRHGRPFNAMNDLTTLAIQGLQIVWINVLLSGDNAVVIALACRGLDERQRRWAILGGSGAAVLLRLVFSVFIVALLQLPYLKLFSGVLLLWLAFDLLRQDEDEKNVKATGSIWGAVRTIALADAIMSLDNVVAVAAAADNNIWLIAFGIGLSVPLIVFGSTLMLRLLKRFPILVVFGAALLGWVAGEIMASDPALPSWLGPLPENVDLWAAAIGAVLILALAGVLRLMRGPPPNAPEHA